MVEAPANHGGRKQSLVESGSHWAEAERVSQPFWRRWLTRDPTSGDPDCCLCRAGKAPGDALIASAEEVDAQPEPLAIEPSEPATAERAMQLSATQHTTGPTADARWAQIQQSESALETETRGITIRLDKSSVSQPLGESAHLPRACTTHGGWRA